VQSLKKGGRRGWMKCIRLEHGHETGKRRALLKDGCVFFTTARRPRARSLIGRQQTLENKQQAADTRQADKRQ
jgi:hypothetical protein